MWSPFPWFCSSSSCLERTSFFFFFLRWKPGRDLCLSYSKFAISLLKEKSNLRRIAREALSTQGLARNHIDHAASPDFKNFGPSSSFFPERDQSSPSARQICKQCELCDNPAPGHVQRWFGLEGSGWLPELWRQLLPLVGHFGCHQPHYSMNIFDRHILDIEAHIVPKKTFT